MRLLFQTGNSIHTQMVGSVLPYTYKHHPIPTDIRSGAPAIIIRHSPKETFSGSLVLKREGGVTILVARFARPPFYRSSLALRGSIHRRYVAYDSAGGLADFSARQESNLSLPSV